MKQKRSHPRGLLVIAFMFLICASSAQADIILGAFDFNSTQFGNTLLESDGGSHSALNWLNISNSDPGNPGYLTGSDFNTGIANIYSPHFYTIVYNTPIVNNAGADFGVVVARYSADDFYLALSADGTNFSSDLLILASSAVATGVQKNYYVGALNQQHLADLFVHPIDISDFGFSSEATITAVRLTGITGGNLDLIRAAGFAPVPLPGAVWLLSSGLLGLAGWRRFRKS